MENEDNCKRCIKLRSLVSVFLLKREGERDLVNHKKQTYKNQTNKKKHSVWFSELRVELLAVIRVFKQSLLKDFYLGL